MEFFIGGLVIWVASGFISIVGIAMPMKKGIDGWDFKMPVLIIFIMIIFGPLSQLAVKIAYNGVMVNSVAKGDE